MMNYDELSKKNVANDHNDKEPEATQKLFMFTIWLMAFAIALCMALVYYFFGMIAFVVCCLFLLFLLMLLWPVC